MSMSARGAGEVLVQSVGDSSAGLGAGARPALDLAPTLDLALAHILPN